MATVLIEGFDKYGTSGTPGALLTQGEWTGIGNTQPSVVAPLSVTGNALQFQDAINSYLYKTLSGNYSRLIGGFRFNCNIANQNCGISFYDNTSAQCSLVINNTTGYISLCQGGQYGNALAISSVSITASTTHFLEYDITFGVSGAYKVLLDGVLIFSGNGATIETGNSYANAVYLGIVGAHGGGAVRLQVDDFYLFDDTTSFNNAILGTNPRIETQYPNTTAQAEWVPLGETPNSAAVAQNPAPGTDTNAVQSDTPGNEDLYGFPALTNNPGLIYTVAVKASTRITTTGTRTITCQTKSGSTDSPGSNAAGSEPALNYTWIDSYFDTDPNTGTVWTPTAVNAATSGPKVTA